MKKTIAVIIDRNNDYDYLSIIIDEFLKNKFKVICFHNYSREKNTYKHYNFPEVKKSPFYNKKKIKFIKFKKKNFIKKFIAFNFKQIFSIYFPVHFIEKENFQKKINEKVSKTWCTVMSVDIFNLCEKLKYMPDNIKVKLLLHSSFYENKIKLHLKKHDNQSYLFFLKNIKIKKFGLMHSSYKELNKKNILKKYNIKTNKKILLYLPFPVELARNRGPLFNGFQIQYSAIDIKKHKHNFIKNFMYKISIFSILIFFNFKYFIYFLKNYRENYLFKKIKDTNKFFIITKPRFKHLVSDFIIKNSNIYFNDKQKNHYPSLLEEIIVISDLVVGYSSNALIKAANLETNAVNIKSDLQDWESPQHFEYAGYENKFYNFKDVIKSVSIKDIIRRPSVILNLKKTKIKYFNQYRKLFIGTPIKFKNLKKLIN